jgi:S-adenosylmethionine-diacylgycerolhomoserine-N-methlytransferase
VFPSPDHLPFLERHFETVLLNESTGKIPYIPLSRMPYYQFIGRKPATPGDDV